MRRTALLMSLLSSVAWAQSADDGFSAPPLLEAEVPQAEGPPIQPSPWPGERADAAGSGAPAAEVQAAPSDSQPPTRYQRRLTAGPLPLIVGVLALEYEHVINERFTVYAGPRVGLANGIGVGGSVGGRYFVNGAAPAGLWFGPELFGDIFYQQKQMTGGTSTTRNLTALAIAMAGYTHIMDSGVTLSGGGGVGMGWADWFHSGPGAGSLAPQGANYVGVIPTLAVHLNAGYAF